MAIPTAFDYQLGEIHAMAEGVVAQLRILKHTGGDGRVLRERLKEFADVVVAAANAIIADRCPDGQ